MKCELIVNYEIKIIIKMAKKIIECPENVLNK